ncbi:hypothetical protein BCR35DRAFT_200196 [Leucosporidium creatinivorum]|uniref:Uncharacterized protein n=1 Tax=Leucosporidium creatinivorum TaxID=106004 RepID=A0A1Y2DJL0_9BASI|nr:hypothetical protein BCR35DRAFT_200196 [Leucosporidium creatinivorum]
MTGWQRALRFRWAELAPLHATGRGWGNISASALSAWISTRFRFVVKLLLSPPSAESFSAEGGGVRRAGCSEQQRVQSTCRSTSS